MLVYQDIARMSRSKLPEINSKCFMSVHFDEKPMCDLRLAIAVETDGIRIGERAITHGKK